MIQVRFDEADATRLVLVMRPPQSRDAHAAVASAPDFLFSMLDRVKRRAAESGNATVSIAAAGAGKARKRHRQRRAANDDAAPVPAAESA